MGNETWTGRNSRGLWCAALLALACAACDNPEPISPAIADAPVDKDAPAGMEAFVLDSEGSGMNAVMYTAAGAKPHPTLLLLHGFPGNEQNLDLAQAARRAGWNVLTFHYRGSWGSEGTFSFSNAARDAGNVLAFLKRPETIERYHIDPNRIAIAGHSMGGFMAANIAAADFDVDGLWLLDPWDMGATDDGLETAEGRAAWHAEVVADLPPLSGTSELALTNELVDKGDLFDLGRKVRAFGNRPLEIIGAERGGGAENAALLELAKSSGNIHATGETWPTDHSFSDHRVKLAERLVAWLATLEPETK
jgi:pimeloyl-ACP methyl ester carboxylesterase